MKELGKSEILREGEKLTKLLKIVEKVNQGNTGGYLNSVEDPFETGSH